MQYISGEVTDPQKSSWQYNGFDCCLTHEIYDRLLCELESVPENVRATYENSLAAVAPVMEMSLRGIHIHSKKLIDTKGAAQRNLAKLEKNFDKLCNEVFGQSVNAGSWQQVSTLLYIWMGLKGKGTQRPHLERLALRYWECRPWVSHILAIRDARKQIGFLNSKLTKDHRMTYSLNVAGTETGRFSCRNSVFRLGTNCQNIDKRHRGIFVADKGKVLIEIDLEQADSRNVGAICYELFGADAYLTACANTDLHSSVAKMLWGDSINPRDVFQHRTSYRQFAKVCGHGTNYMGSARGIANITGIPASLVTAFQKLYFKSFPEILEWHKWTKAELRNTRCITTLFGRRRHFHDRTWDDGTVRKAVAYQGQSMTADETNLGIVALWRQHSEVEVLLQVHDSCLFQIPEEAVAKIPEYMKAMQVSLAIREKEFSVPLSCQVGKSWLSKKAGGDMIEWDG